jgi:hypothetical protein
MVIAKGIPSIEKQRTSTQEEEKRVAKQIKEQGTEGLMQREIELKQAIKENEVPEYNVTSKLYIKSKHVQKCIIDF